MPDSQLQIDEREIRGVTVLTLTGEMLFDDGDLAFGRRVNELVARERVKILVDLAAVTAIDSSGVGMMVAKLKDLQKLGGDMRLLRLTAPCHRLLNVLKLRTTFEVFDDEVTALRSYELRPHG
jgi:stage II sporulation protein AA (anti-sigma F factor antagonist)